MLSATFLLGVAVKGTAILLTTWLGALTFRRCSAAARHLLWAGAFAALLVLPLFSLLLPAVQVRIPDPLLAPVLVIDTAA